MDNERILVFGPQGSGKTFQLLQIAKLLPKSHFFILDTDDSYPRSLSEFPNLRCQCKSQHDDRTHGNVHVTFGYDWEEYIKWRDDTLKIAKPDIDWLVVDRVDKAWERVQNFCNEEVYSLSLAERLLQARKDMKKKAMVISANDRADWQLVNAQYLGWFLSIMYKSRCNIYLAAGVKSVSEKDDEQTKDTYSPLGVKPAGQKGLPHEPHTVLYLSGTGKSSNNHYVTTLKDRGKRIYLSKEPIENLGVEYLFTIAEVDIG